MKLALKRGQKDIKGLLGGHKGVKFEISATAKLTDEERTLVSQYLPGGMLLYEWEYRRKRGAELETRSVTVGSLLRGEVFECDSLGDIIDLENGLVSGANQLYEYLRVASSFGGEVEIEIPTSEE